MNLAKIIPPGKTEKDLILGEPAAPRPPSSAPLFEAMRAHVETLRRAGPGPQAGLRGFDQLPEYVAYRARIAKAAPKPVGPPSQLDLVKEARTDLLVGAMLHSELNKTLGLGYDDQNVSKGAKLQYALRTLDAKNVEGPVDAATTEIVVGSDPQPKPPTGLAVAQLHDGTDTVSLRWERLSEKEETEVFGIASYNIFRNGVKLNATPVFVADPEPPTLFLDTQAEPGTVTYKVTFVDLFGRESAPASKDYAVLDLREPHPVKQEQAALQGTNVSVIWQSSDEPGVQYSVTRT